MRYTLVILAAGIGSRFGGVKQLQRVGPGGELLIDYSVHDAILAGFDRIVFILRRAIEADFMDRIGSRLEKVCAAKGVEICYVFQELSDVPIPVPEGRVRPWGTGHAVLCCRELLKEPFAVVNADDYYGQEGFVRAIDCLKRGGYGLVGYTLKNTLSEYGGVTRGICRVENGMLVGIEETRGVEKLGNGAVAGGRSLDVDSLVSMNFWCFPPEFLEELEKDFGIFLAEMTDSLKDEFLLPVIMDGMLHRGTRVEVLSSGDKWFGMTYPEDREVVVESFRRLYGKRIYQEELYSDL